MRRLAAVVLPLAAVLALALWRAQGPQPRPASAPAGVFSAERAMHALGEVLQEGVPHPVGSPANAVVRDRLVARFHRLGYQTSIQRRFACNALPACAMVENIIARAPGQSQDAVVLVAHYDSVPSGPGGSDDGMGVASLLEAARAVQGQRFRNPITFLVTDGEEAGLLGAEAFVADEALSRDAAVFVNVENRGTRGLSNMFETSRGNRWLIHHLARGLERPQATSFFYTVYNYLPNDTDVTVFKRAGKAAVNFAAIGGVNWYHTPFDDLSHASPRTLQHHGDNLLGTLRALADADLAARSNDDASFFDVLGFFLIWWPAGATVWVAVISLVLLLFAARKSNPRAMTLGVLGTFTAILMAVLAGLGMSWILQLRSPGVNWTATPLPTVAALWLIGFAAAIFGMALFRKKSDERALLYGCAIVWHAVAITLALTLTGAAFVFLVPAMIVTICALARTSETTAVAAASTVAAILFFPMGLMLYEALGSRLMVVVAVIIGLMATLVAPVFARSRYGAILSALAILCAVVALLLPAVTPEKPRGQNLAYVDDPAAAPMWTSNAAMAGFQPADPELTPWSRSSVWSAPAPRIDVPRALLTGTRKTGGVTLRVRSQRGAKRIVLALRGGTITSINGVPPAAQGPRVRLVHRDGWRFAVANGVEEIVVEVAATGPVDVVTSDATYGLPATGAHLAQARSAMNAFPIHDGDATITRARARF